MPVKVWNPFDVIPPHHQKLRVWLERLWPAVIGPWVWKRLVVQLSFAKERQKSRERRWRSSRTNWSVSRWEDWQSKGWWFKSDGRQNILKFESKNICINMSEITSTRGQSVVVQWNKTLSLEQCMNQLRRLRHLVRKPSKRLPGPRADQGQSVVCWSPSQLLYIYSGRRQGNADDKSTQELVLFFFN